MRPSIPEPLPITDISWTDLIPQMGRANRALARFDGILNHLESPDLLIAPLTTREAVLSSKIEGTVVTVGQVMLFEAGESPDHESERHDIEEVVNYRETLALAENALKHRPMSLNMVKNLHNKLLTGVRGHNKAPGSFRKVQNHIGRPNSSIEQAEFVPPSPEKLLPALYEWEKYYHYEEQDALVQLAVIHAQFEFLHPFLDGNGRIGRILIPIFLFEQKLLSRPCFYLSEYLEEHRDEYISRLRQLGVSKNAWTEWCLFFLDALAIEAEKNAERVQAILDLYKKTKLKIMEITHSRYAVPLLDAIFANPYFTTGNFLVRDGMPERNMLMRLLDKLVKEKILSIRTEASGRRPAIYQFRPLIDLCDTSSARNFSKKLSQG